MVSATSYHGVLDRFEQDRDIHSLLVERVTLPFPVTVRLIALVSKDLQQRLVLRHGMPLSLIEPVALQGQERALLDSLSAMIAMADVEEAAALLLAREALTPSLLLRALCAGRLDLFTAFVAALAGTPIAAVGVALESPDSAAFRSLFGRTQLPAHLQRAFRVALGVVLEVEFYRAAGWQSGDEELIIHGLVREYRQLSPGSLEGILGQIGRLPPDL